MNNIEKIISFLNVEPEKIEKAEPKLLAEMLKAIRNDDFFKIHHLGYNLNR